MPCRGRGICHAFAPSRVFFFRKVLALLFTPEGDVLVALPWGYIGTESVLNAIRIILRLVACAVPLFLTFYVTKLTDMANAMVKILHLPYKYAFTFTSTSWRSTERRGSSTSTFCTEMSL